MSTQFAIFALLIAGLINALIAGVFFAFSDFVMKSLVEDVPGDGARIMQAINRNVYHSGFIALFFMMTALAAVLGMYAYFILEGPVSQLLKAAACLYLIGVFLVTAGGNVPMNKQLESQEASRMQKGAWSGFVSDWVNWNHTRWICALGASACYIMAATLVANGNNTG